MILPTREPRRAEHWLLIAMVGLVQLRMARAEDAISYKYQDYRESAGRIGVQVHSALIEKDLGSSLAVRISGVVDTIAGATPTGEPERTPGGQVPLSNLEEERTAWSADFSKQFKAVRMTLGAAGSRESDYVSRVWSANALADFNRKNTAVALGVAVTDDDVRVFFQQERMAKDVVDVMAGVTQVIDGRTQASFTLTYSDARGFLSDPYKLVEKHVEVVPGVFLRRTFNENRPDTRSKWIAVAALNRAWPRWNGALDASWRFHRDDYGIGTHTLNLEWYQSIARRLTLRPHVRVMTQGAADFYLVTLTGSPITPAAEPTGHAPYYYSSDYRLSSLRTFNYGLKAVWTPNETWQLDAAVEHYEMRGRDGVTSASAYPRAAIITVGMRFAF